MLPLLWDTWASPFSVCPSDIWSCSASRGPQWETTKTGRSQCPVSFLWAPFLPSLPYAIGLWGSLPLLSLRILTELPAGNHWPPKVCLPRACALGHVRTVELIKLLNSYISPASHTLPKHCGWGKGLCVRAQSRSFIQAAVEHTRLLATPSLSLNGSLL